MCILYVYICAIKVLVLKNETILKYLLRASKKNVAFLLLDTWFREMCQLKFDILLLFLHSAFDQVSNVRSYCSRNISI